MNRTSFPLRRTLLSLSDLMVPSWQPRQTLQAHHPEDVIAPPRKSQSGIPDIYRGDGRLGAGPGPSRAAGVAEGLDDRCDAIPMPGFFPARAGVGVVALLVGSCFCSVAIWARPGHNLLSLALPVLSLVLFGSPPALFAHSLVWSSSCRRHWTVQVAYQRLFRHCRL